MNDTYLPYLKAFRANILQRKIIVKEEISKWREHKDCNCAEMPDAPCCLLQTELGLLNKYVDILDRELWHMENKEDGGHGSV